MNIQPYLIIALKSVTVYLFIVLAIRFFGKKELSQLSVIDLVFILLLSNSVQNAMVGNNNSLEGGLVAALALFIGNYILKFFINKYSKFGILLEGEKIILVNVGKVLKNGLRQAMMSEDEVERAVREHGVDNIKDADLVVLEVDGNISVLSDDYKKKTNRRRKKLQLRNL